MHSSYSHRDWLSSWGSELYFGTWQLNNSPKLELSHRRVASQWAQCKYAFLEFINPQIFSPSRWGLKWRHENKQARWYKLCTQTQRWWTYLHAASVPATLWPQHRFLFEGKTKQCFSSSVRLPPPSSACLHTSSCWQVISCVFKTIWQHLKSYISFAASVCKEQEETRHSHTFPKIKDELASQPEWGF